MMTDKRCEIVERKSSGVNTETQGVLVDLNGQKKFEEKDTSDSDFNEFWVFGYGSLVWKVDFPIECSRTGYIKGYLRRFYQNSIDHRGTRAKPGRVVTLIPADDPESKVFGMAYKIPVDKTKQVLEHLDFREKNGYERHSVKFFPFDTSEIGDVPKNHIVIYVATHDNESFAGPSPSGGVGTIVDQIIDAIGPSGTNREYVYQLADAMRRYFPNQNDEHLFEIENLLKEREGRLKIPL